MSQHSGERGRDASPPPEEQPPCSKARGDVVSMSHSNLEELLAEVAFKAAKEALASHGPASSSSVPLTPKSQALADNARDQAQKGKDRKYRALQTMDGKRVPVSQQDNGIVHLSAFLGAKVDPRQRALILTSAASSPSVPRDWSPTCATSTALPIEVDLEDDTGMDLDHSSECGSNDGDESHQNFDSEDDSPSSHSGSRASSPSAMASGSVDPSEHLPNPGIDVHSVRSKRSALAKPAFHPRIAKFAGPYGDGAFSIFLPLSETADRKKANKELKTASGPQRAKRAVTELMRADSDARQLQDEALVFLAPMLDGASDIPSFMEEHEAQITHMIQLASNIPPHEKLLAEWETLDKRVKEASYLDFHVWANRVTRKATERLLGSISELMIPRNGTTQVASRGLNNLVDGLKGLTYHHLSRTNSARQLRIINAINPTQALKVRPDALLKLYPVEEDHKKSLPPLQLLSGKQLKSLLKQPASSSSSALIALAEAKRKTDTKLGPGSSSKCKATPCSPFDLAPSEVPGTGANLWESPVDAVAPAPVVPTRARARAPAHAPTPPSQSYPPAFLALSPAVQEGVIKARSTRPRGGAGGEESKPELLSWQDLPAVRAIGSQVVASMRLGPLNNIPLANGGLLPHLQRTLSRPDAPWNSGWDLEPRTFRIPRSLSHLDIPPDESLRLRVGQRRAASSSRAVVSLDQYRERLRGRDPDPGAGTEPSPPLADPSNLESAGADHRGGDPSTSVVRDLAATLPPDGNPAAGTLPSPGEDNGTPGGHGEGSTSPVDPTVPTAPHTDPGTSSPLLASLDFGPGPGMDSGDGQGGLEVGLDSELVNTL
ncbi:hypothetical protein HDU93_000807 [Gonapodya sp. JEL0774]|nr:hypothetical protein HDU93_000807 [Gonapodya sp. JEL0774]